MPSGFLVGQLERSECPRQCRCKAESGSAAAIPGDTQVGWLGTAPWQGSLLALVPCGLSPGANSLLGRAGAEGAESGRRAPRLRVLDHCLWLSSGLSPYWPPPPAPTRRESDRKQKQPDAAPGEASQSQLGYFGTWLIPPPGHHLLFSGLLSSLGLRALPSPGDSRDGTWFPCSVWGCC